MEKRNAKRKLEFSHIVKIVTTSKNNSGLEEFVEIDDDESYTETTIPFEDDDEYFECFQNNYGSEESDYGIEEGDYYDENEYRIDDGNCYKYNYKYLESECENESDYRIDDGNYHKYLEPECEIEEIDDLQNENDMDNYVNGMISNDVDDLAISVGSMELEKAHKFEMEQSNLGYFWIPWNTEECDLNMSENQNNSFVLENINDETQYLEYMATDGEIKIIKLNHAEIENEIDDESFVLLEKECANDVEIKDEISNESDGPLGREFASDDVVRNLNSLLSPSPIKNLYSKFGQTLEMKPLEGKALTSTLRKLPNFE